MNSTHTTIQRVAAAVAIFNNVLWIVLIKFKSHQKLGNYKYFMIYISIFEILYAVLDALTVPEIYSKGSTYLVVIRADQSLLPHSCILFADVMFCVFFGISMAIFAIHFIYRYLVVSKSPIICKFDRQVVISLLAFPIFFGAFWFCVTYFFIKPFKEANEFLYENLLKNQNMSIDDVTYMGPFFWPEGPDGNSFLYMKSFFGIMIMTAAILSSFFLIFYYGVKCYRSTKELLDSASQSISFQVLQSQLFYALVFQTLIPVILMHIPASVGFIISFLNISVELSGTICSITICLYPALDPLPNFFIIKSYRDAICDSVRQIKMKIMCQKDNRVGMLASGNSDMYSVSSRAFVVY